ncbi:hypothetical protein KAU33_02270 [Candidatus Dependentiae bacterium]|nr:hypothetical protein [Candidatus Dependentiae bacterium]
MVMIIDGTDRVSIYTDLPSPYPAEISTDDLEIDFQTRKGSGVDYVREHFGIEPEILDIATKMREV